MRIDRIVTQPCLVGPRLRGIPCDYDGFIHTDAHGRVVGIDDVYAAGDATDTLVKDGGVAALQADTVAAMIAFAAGIDVEPQLMPSCKSSAFWNRRLPSFRHEPLA